MGAGVLMTTHVVIEVDTRDDYTTALEIALVDTTMQVAEMYGVPLYNEDGGCLRCDAEAGHPDDTCPNCELIQQAREASDPDDEEVK